MILVFDLDDTLYDEMTYVESGFRAVAAWGEINYGFAREASYRTLCRLLTQHGRGRVFNLWLDRKGCVRTAVREYRHHAPKISLWPAADRALASTAAFPAFLVTDGHKVVQANKVAALGIADRFAAVYLTHRYGRRHAKPSPYCFDLIRRRSACRWQDMVHIADNPAKDFVGLNGLGVRTVRVLTGQHRQVSVPPACDAEFHISSLNMLPALLERIA